ncbi:MAG: Trk system potassium transporter TrkA [Acidobacteria bacterium]|nr:Trk system potassium transporter TrkA [Acidobacteriota bacterium]MDA1233191.1 Trk system potassium transporter TrkA [Acidobacteriota bacterium]
MRILIAGGGQSATLIASRLIREGNEITIVEKDAARCAHLDETLDAKVVRGSAASIRTLLKAGLDTVQMLIAVTNSDEINVLACVIAKTFANVKVKVARVRSHEFADWRRVADENELGIDLIIHPESDVMERILRVVNVPGVSDIIDFADGEVKLFGMNVEHDSWFAGKTLEELDAAGPPANSLVALIFRGQQVIIPHGAQVVLPGDHVYVCATKQNLDAVLEFMGVARRGKLKRVFIVGGKQIGISLAQELERQGVQVKLIEKDAGRCELIAGLVKKTIVVKGDGTDQATLEEENIEGVDAFLALTQHDEDNIIASLLARRLGVGKVVALINRLSYLSMVQRLGVNTSVSMRLSTVDAVLQFVRKGGVLSVTTFREEEAEAIELIASEGSRYVGKKLRDIALPRGAIVGAIARTGGEVIVPRGNVAIEPGDRVIFFALESVVPELESAFLDNKKRRQLLA